MSEHQGSAGITEAGRGAQVRRPEIGERKEKRESNAEASAASATKRGEAMRWLSVCERKKLLLLKHTASKSRA